MDYSKIAASKQKQKEKPTQPIRAYNRSEEQERLLNCIRSSRSSEKPCTQPENKTWQNTRKNVLQKYSLLNLGNLSKRISELKIKEEETTEEKVQRLKRTLRTFESPFIWKPRYNKFTTQDQKFISKLQEKDEEIVDEKKFKWRNFILQLVISYELYLENRLTEALEAILELEKIVVENEGSVEWLFLGIKDALWHVVTTSKAFLSLELNLLEEADKSVDHVQPVRTMRRAGRAGILGIKAAVFMEYGHEGNKNALPFAKQAVELDATSPEWHFLVGKCMGRIRRVASCHSNVDPLEGKSLNKANQLDSDNPLYRLYVAQIIRERTFRDYKTRYPQARSEERGKIERAFKAAYFKYLEAKEMRPNCPHILTRCAYGLMKLPFQYVNLKLIRECLDKAIELAPNNMMSHHVKGLYHERFGIEADLALKEFTVAAELGNFGASMDLVRMRYRLRKGDDVVQELEEIAERFFEPAFVQVAYTQAGSYLLFIKFNLIEAIKYFTKVISIDLASYAMKSHKSLFIRMKDPVNLFHVLLEELDKNTNWGSFSKEQSQVLKKFRIRILQHDDLESKENRPTVSKILEMSKRQGEIDIEKWEKKQRKKEMRRSWKGNIRLKRKFRKKKSEKGNAKKACVENNMKDPLELKDAGKAKSSVRQQKSIPRSCSVTSVSSVDSDYQRNSVVHGQRGFFFNEDSNDSNAAASSREYTSTDNVNDSNMSGRFSEHMSRFRSFHSRDSSVCSISSDEHIEGDPLDFKSRRAFHSSRYTSEVNASNKTENTLSKVSLSMENLRLFDSAGSGCLRPRTPSVSSMEYEPIATERLSVMDRVKQSYAMLNRGDNRANRNETKNLRRSESCKSLNKSQRNTGRYIPRTDSSQSLNVEVESIAQKLERYKPFGSRDSVESSRSYSFMPSFASKDSNKDNK